MMEDERRTDGCYEIGVSLLDASREFAELAEQTMNVVRESEENTYF